MIYVVVVFAHFLLGFYLVFNQSSDQTNYSVVFLLKPTLFEVENILQTKLLRLWHFKLKTNETFQPTVSYLFNICFEMGIEFIEKLSNIPRNDELKLSQSECGV